jgi:hypothetical protein
VDVEPQEERDAPTDVLEALRASVEAATSSKARNGRGTRTRAKPKRGRRRAKSAR